MRACWAATLLLLVDDFQLPAPLVEASSGHPQLARQLNDIFAGLHALYSHPLKFPGVSFPLLHPLVSSPGNCAHSCVSLQGFIPGPCSVPSKPRFALAGRVSIPRDGRF